VNFSGVPIAHGSLYEPLMDALLGNELRGGRKKRSFVSLVLDRVWNTSRPVSILRLAAREVG